MAWHGPSVTLGVLEVTWARDWGWAVDPICAVDNGSILPVPWLVDPSSLCQGPCAMAHGSIVPVPGILCQG